MSQVRAYPGLRPADRYVSIAWAPVLATMWALLSTVGASFATETNVLRRFPYPFSHMISFASDVDQQAPWHGAAIHRVINEEIGLPISDSLWAQGASTDASSLFLGGVDLNIRPSGMGTHSTAGLLIRQWHRGNIDTLHSWQDDGTPPLVQHIAQPVELASISTIIAIEPAPKGLASLYYRHLRVYFDAPPPKDMSWKLFDNSGKSVVIGVGQIKAGEVVKSALSRPPFIIEVVTGVPPDIGLPVTRETFDLFHLTKIEILASSCGKGCATKATRVDRDNFSRQAVGLQVPWLEAFNIRPVILMSHGGWSFAQNFGAASFSLFMKREHGSAYESSLVPNKLRLLGNDPDQYAYHSDLLRRLGVNSLWPYSIVRKQLWNQQSPPLSSGIPGFYELIRTTNRTYRTSSLEDFLLDVRIMEPRLRAVDLDAIYCARTCWGDQGAVLGLLVALSLSQTEIRSYVDQLWSTHLATGDDDFNRSIETPLRQSAVAWMRRLANHYYNFDGQIKPARRVWVPPAGTVARYRIAHAQIARHLQVDATTSRVQIMPWKDPVTGQTIPDPVAGTRDLHGITIYVPASSKASVIVAGRETHSFTRNLPDATGRTSVTLVDDSTPTVLVEETALANNGSTSVSGAKWESAESPGKDAAPGSRYVTILASGGDAVVRWRPSQLDLWNITHLQLAYRKSAGGNIATRGRFFCEIEMHDGGIVYVAETAAPASGADASGWLIPKSSGSSNWTRQTLSLAELRWPSGKAYEAGKRPPLPLGRVREVRFGLLDAAPGERLDIDRVAAFRPNSNNVDPTGSKLIGGQVISVDGKPASSVVVQAELPGIKKMISTVTDKNGYYYFFRQPVGRILKIAASHNGRLCAPLRGSFLQVRKDDPEIDIALNHCQNQT